MRGRFGQHSPDGLKLTLAGAGYQIVQAGDGAEGLAKARESAVNLVVTDLNMPVMNGLGLIVRKGKVTASRELIAVTLTAKDHMRLLIERPETADAAAADEILRSLKHFVEGTPASVPSESAAATWRIQFRLAENAMAMGTNPLLLLDELRALGTATVTALTDAIPPLDVLVPTNCHVGWDVILSTSHPRSAIEDVFLFVIDDMDLKITAIGDTNGEANRLGEIFINRGDVEPEAVANVLSSQVPLGRLLVKSGALDEDKLTSALAEQEHVRAETRATAAADSIRVPAERLDELMDRVGELMIAQSRLTQVAANSNDAQVKSVAEEIERLAVELRDTTMGVRTLPIGSRLAASGGWCMTSRKNWARK